MRLTICALALATALLGGACSKSSAPTKAQYAGVANGVCESADKDYRAMQKALAKTKPSQGEQQRWVRQQAVPRLRQMTGQLRSIQPPDREANYLDSMYSDYEHAVALFYADPLGDSYRPAERAAEKRLVAYGMTSCHGIGEGKATDKASESAAGD